MALFGNNRKWVTLKTIARMIDCPLPVLTAFVTDPKNNFEFMLGVGRRGVDSYTVTVEEARAIIDRDSREPIYSVARNIARRNRIQQRSGGVPPPPPVQK